MESNPLFVVFLGFSCMIFLKVLSTFLKYFRKKSLQKATQVKVLLYFTPLSKTVIKQLPKCMNASLSLFSFFIYSLSGILQSNNDIASKS